MRFGKKIKYQIENYKRILKAVFDYSKLPNWLVGRIARCAIFCALIVCSTGYVIQITSATSSGYEMRNLQRKVNELQFEINKTNTEIFTFGSLQNLEKRINGLSMARVNNIVYITDPDVMFAKK